jgi:hypothetical protein
VVVALEVAVVVVMLAVELAEVGVEEVEVVAEANHQTLMEMIVTLLKNVVVDYVVNLDIIGKTVQI